jgi:hypothetical protein
MIQDRKRIIFNDCRGQLICLPRKSWAKLVASRGAATSTRDRGICRAYQAQRGELTEMFLSQGSSARAQSMCRGLTQESDTPLPRESWPSVIGTIRKWRRSLLCNECYGRLTQCSMCCGSNYSDLRNGAASGRNRTDIRKFQDGLRVAVF